MIIRNCIWPSDLWRDPRGAPDSPAPCSRSGSSSSNASASSSRHRRLTARSPIPARRTRATICSKSARPSAKGSCCLRSPRGPRSVRGAVVDVYASVVTDSRHSVWSSGWTSPVSGPTSGTGCCWSTATPRSARRIPVWTRTSTSPPTRAFVKWHAGQLSWKEATDDSGSSSTVPHGWYAPSRAGTAAAVRRHQARRRRRCHHELTQRPAAEPLLVGAMSGTRAAAIRHGCRWRRSPALGAWRPPPCPGIAGRGRQLRRHRRRTTCHQRARFGRDPDRLLKSPPPRPRGPLMARHVAHPITTSGLRYRVPR